MNSFKPNPVKADFVGEKKLYSCSNINFILLKMYSITLAKSNSSKTTLILVNIFENGGPRSAEIAVLAHEHRVPSKLEVSQFLKFSNCELQFQGRNLFFSMNWPNNQYWSMFGFPQNEEL